MKAYVLVVKRRRYQNPTVRVCWSNTECSDRIIGFANSLRKSPCEPSFKLGDALNTLDNLGFDVHTYPVDCDPPPSLEDALFEYSKTFYCGDCGDDISEAQAGLSKARFDGAPAECKDCCTRKLTGTKAAGKKARRTT